jgi:hypothetical protein
MVHLSCRFWSFLKSGFPSSVMQGVTNQRRVKFSINRMLNLHIFQTQNVCPCVSEKYHRMPLLERLTESSVACMFWKQDSITNSNHKFF